MGRFVVRVIAMLGLVVPAIALWSPAPQVARADAFVGIWDGTEPAPLRNEGGVYFPWVTNDYEPVNPEGEDPTGLGTADTAVTIQNLDSEAAIVFAFVGIGEGGLTDPEDDNPTGDETNGWDMVGPFHLAGGASKTFLPEQIGIMPGDGAPVNFSAYHELRTMNATVRCSIRLGGWIEPGADVNGNGECTDVEVRADVSMAGESSFTVCVVNDMYGNPEPFFDKEGNVFEWSDVDELRELVLTGPSTIIPAGLNRDGDCSDEERPAVEGEGTQIRLPAPIAGYAKQAVGGEELPFTSMVDPASGEVAADSSVSGYNALSGDEILKADQLFNQWYLPVVQTNAGPGGRWNTIVRIANFGLPYTDLRRERSVSRIDSEIDVLGQSAITIRFFPAENGAGSHNTGFQLEKLLNAGDVWHIDVSRYLPPDWVGSAHIYTDGAVFAMADRIKPGFSQWLTNTASNAGHSILTNNPSPNGDYVLYAPDLRRDYYGWNTGINIANLADEDNTVTIQYLNAYGANPVAMTKKLGPQGMTYIYDPSSPTQGGSNQDASDGNAEVLGSALIWSEYPIAAVIDATKYPANGNSANVQSFSYSATANVFHQQAFPLIQKGSSVEGSGAVSGINVMNPHDETANVTVRWFNQSGFPASNYGVVKLSLPPHSNGIVYTPYSQNLPYGFYGSAVLTASLPVAAVTTQADYRVGSDGSAVWNAYNPCGFYRDAGNDCTIEPPPVTEPDVVPVTVRFVDEEQQPIAGVVVRFLHLASPLEFTASSDINGEVSWPNVVPGNYTLMIDTVPRDGDFPLFTCPPAYTTNIPANQPTTLTIECGPGPINPNAPGIMNIVYQTGVYEGLSLYIYVYAANEDDITSVESPVAQHCALGDPIIDHQSYSIHDSQLQIELPPGDYCVVAQRLNGPYHIDSPITLDPADPDDDTDMLVP